MIRTLVSNLAICAALGLFAYSVQPGLAQTGPDAAEVEAAETTRNLRELRAELRDGVSGAARAQVLSELEALGADGDGTALLLLGDALRDADEIEAAIEAYEAAIEAGEDRGSLQLMRILGDEDSPFYDADRATAMMLDAAESGHTGAQFALARALLEGDGVDEDPEQARQILLDLATENTAAAQLAGDLLRDGTGGPENVEEAARLYRLAAEGGRDTAWLRLGILLQSGEGVARDPEGAHDAFERAADGTHAGAAARARLLLLRGHVREEFGALSDASRVTELAAEPLNAGDVGIARIVVSDAANKVPDDMLARALDILYAGLTDENQGAARTLFSYWTRERAVRPDMAEAEIGRLVADHTSLLPERNVLRLRIDELAPHARTVGQYQELSDLLLNASAESLPAAFVVLRSHNANAYVHALQSMLEKHGFYSGPKNGLLTSSTILAIGRLCASAGISGECALGPLRGPVVRSIGAALAELS